MSKQKKVKQTHMTLVYDSGLFFKEKGFDRKIETIMEKHGGTSDGSGMGFGQRDMTIQVPTVNFKAFEKEVKALHGSVECLVNHKD